MLQANDASEPDYHRPQRVFRQKLSSQSSELQGIRSHHASKRKADLQPTSLPEGRSTFAKVSLIRCGSAYTDKLVMFSYRPLVLVRRLACCWSNPVSVDWCLCACTGESAWCASTVFAQEGAAAIR